MSWMRLDSTAGDHPKLRRLAANLGTSQPLTLGLVTGAWLFALRFAPDGNLGSFSVEDLEAAIGWDGEPGAFTRAMIDVRLIDLLDGGAMVIHDWADHAGSFKEASRKRAEREAKRANVSDSPGASGTVQENPPYGRDGRTDRTHKTEEGASRSAFPALILKDDPAWQVPPEIVSELEALFPHLSPAIEFAKASAWFEANPAGRVTRKHARQRLLKWFADADRFAKEASARPNGAPRPPEPVPYKRPRGDA